ncbi:HAD family hydrolase [Ruania albidiflava]|uniref:HAD family hydrolase n=1 Tax=Ruania albidiflava TaxID=366586 RepID=UPI0023EF6469|nr:HAD family hydrolase [Ruania albidiflava]
MSISFEPVALTDITAGPTSLVALDIDGTILHHDGTMSEAVRTAVQEVAATGTHVVLSTGRSTHACLPVLAELGLDSGWAVCSNGAVVARLDPDIEGGYEFTDIVTFDPGPTLRLLREHLPEGIFAVEDLGRGYAVTSEFPAGELSGAVRVIDFEQMCAEPAVRVTVRAPGLGSADFHDLVNRSGLHGVSYAVGWTAWLDIAPDGVSKASALELVRQRLDVPPEATLAAGDGQNDIEMLGWAGVSVAMGGADEVTRAAARWHTGPVEAEGLVPVLDAVLRSRRE